MSVVNIAKGTHKKDKNFMTVREFKSCILIFDSITENQKKEASSIILKKIIYLHDILNIESFFILYKYVPFDYFIKNIKKILLYSAMVFENEPIFSDITLTKVVAYYLKQKPNNQYFILLVLYNNGFGDKNEIKKYINSIDILKMCKMGKFSNLYNKVKEYINKEDEN